MVSGPRVGIDFGTSNTVTMAQWQGEQVLPLLFDASPLLPSAVFATGDRLLVGRDAERSARIDPAGFEPNPKRRIDDGTVLLGATAYPVVDLVAEVLRRCLDEAERVAGRPLVQVVLTHPAGWGPQRRAVLTAAAARAGVDRVELVPEPTAAAVYFTRILGQRVTAGRSVVVYDFGGGTFDVAVVRRHEPGWEVVDSAGLDVGGVDLDAVVVDGVRAALANLDPTGWSRLREPRTTADRRNRWLLWEDARAVKELLSRNPTADLHLPIFDTDVHVTRDEFERRARSWLDRTVDLTEATLRRSGVSRDAIAGLMLVGGSSRIPLVATMLHQRLGIAPTAIEQPELVVAQGCLLAVPPPAAPVPVRHAVTTRPLQPPPGTPEAPAPRPVQPQPAAVDAPQPSTQVAPVPPPPYRSAPAVARGGAGAPRRKRRTPLVLGGVAAVVVIALVIAVVAWFNRSQRVTLTAEGESRAAQFQSVALRNFAHNWLNAVSQCVRVNADLNASEQVICNGDSWAVNFRGYASKADRNLGRQTRLTAYQGQSQRRAGAGVRITYRQEDRLQVVYWDTGNAWVSGDLFSTQLGNDELLKVWAKYTG